MVKFMERFSLPILLRAYHQNKDIIDAYYTNKSIEGSDESSDKVMGMTIGIFMMFLILSLVLYVWAIWLLIGRWSFVKGWVKVISILALLFGMPIITVILMYAGTQAAPVDMMRMCGRAHF